MDDSIQQLRTALTRVAHIEWQPEWPLHAEQEPAAVLIAVEASSLDILLTRRTDHLHHHPGQISLPGGRMEATDLSPLDAALREAEEEIGLAPQMVEILGALPDYATSSGFRVTPQVGLIHTPFTPRLDSFEVAELIRLPMSAIVDASNWQLHRIERGGARRHFHAIPWRGRFIWGATAGMLAMLATCLRTP